MKCEWPLVRDASKVLECGLLCFIALKRRKRIKRCNTFEDI
jgi:hypothetical protein